MKCLFLAGGYDQIVFIQALRSRGIRVILADYNYEPLAAREADMFYQVSTLDSDAILKIAREQEIDQVLTACTDQALLTMAYVSEQMGTYSYLSYEQALSVTNKLYMKKRMLSSGIPTAPAYFIDSMVDEDRAEAMPYPVVVKPADCNSSKGVRRVAGKDECRGAIREALDLSRSNTVIVEKFLEGEEVSADIWLNGQDPVLLGLSQTNKIPGKDGFTITQSVYPADISNKSIERIQDIAATIAREFNLANMPLLLQLVVQGDNPYVLEFSARMGGGTKYRLIEEMSGVDIVQLYLEMALGKRVVCDVPFLKTGVLHLDYVYMHPGVFSGMNFDHLSNDGSIDDFFQYKPIGTPIEKAETSSDRVAGVLLKAKDNKELLDKEEVFLNQAEVYDEHGINAMLRGIYQ